MDLDAYLGDAEATAEQRDAIMTAHIAIEERFTGEDADLDRDPAFSGAVQYILGDDTLKGLGYAWQKAVRQAEDARLALVGAIIAADQTLSESEISRQTGMTRVTVRKALGK